MAITAAMVKELREKTSAGMMDCKKALTENGGDLEAAVKWLREKGLASAGKKSGRVTAEGLVGICVQGSSAGVLEVNCETDFVAKNSDFQTLVADLTAHVVDKTPSKVKSDDPGEGEALYAQNYTASSTTVEDFVKSKIATIGENITLRRFKILNEGDAYGSYAHDGGRIGSVVELKLEDSSKASAEEVLQLGKDLAMHIAAEAPLAIDRSGLDPAVIEAEREIYKNKALADGKPENIVDKIVVGQVNKFVAGSCLVDQAFVKDPDIKVGKLIEQISEKIGTGITISAFERFKVGDGIEKKQDNLAEEVAKMTGAA